MRALRPTKGSPLEEVRGRADARRRVGTVIAGLDAQERTHLLADMLSAEVVAERDRLDVLIGALGGLTRERTSRAIPPPDATVAPAGIGDVQELIRRLSAKWRGDARRLLWLVRERQTVPRDVLLAELGGISAYSLDSLIRGVGKDARRGGTTSTLFLRLHGGSVHAGPSLLAMTLPWTATGEMTMTTE